jgi:hypothetical protein
MSTLHTVTGAMATLTAWLYALAYPLVYFIGAIYALCHLVINGSLPHTGYSAIKIKVNEEKDKQQEQEHEHEHEKKKEKQKQLEPLKEKHSDADTFFPTTIHFSKLIACASSAVKPCSTDTDTAFITSTNSNGEVIFKLDTVGHAHGHNGSEEHLVPYSNDQLTPDSDNQHSNVHKSAKNGFISLSPVSSVKSTSSSGSNSSGTPMNKINLKTANEEEDEDDEDEEEDVSDSEKHYQCPHCDSKFKIRSYLTRHAKKHSSEKAYHCPFHRDTPEGRCHQTGGFSRRDTFKTHLKARHFKYPPGVKSNRRVGMMGWCGICGEKFLNNEIWVERHIEMGLCPGLPDRYIKTLKIGKKKTGKHSKFLDVHNVNESLELGKHKGITVVTGHPENGNVNSNVPYLQSPSSINSSPNPNVSMQQSQMQVPTTLPVQAQMQMQMQMQIPPTSTAMSTPQSYGSHISLEETPMVDAETLELLQKQQELERIIGLLKQKQSQEQLEKERNAAMQALQAQAQAKARAQVQAQAQSRQMQIQWLQQLQQLQQLHQIQQTQTQSPHGQNRGDCEDLTVPLNEQQLRAFLARQLQLQGKCSGVDTNAIVNASVNVPAVSVDEDDYPSLEG